MVSDGQWHASEMRGTGLSGLWPGIRDVSRSQVLELFAFLCREERENGSEYHPTESKKGSWLGRDARRELEGRTNHSAGLCPSLDARPSLNRRSWHQAQVCARTSCCHGAGTRQAIAAHRTRAPQERRHTGQQPGEPRTLAIRPSARATRRGKTALSDLYLFQALRLD